MNHKFREIFGLRERERERERDVVGGGLEQIGDGLTSPSINDDQIKKLIFEILIMEGMGS